MRNGYIKLLSISLGSGIFLTGFLYALSYLLSRMEGFSQLLGSLIAMLLAFPLFVFFHDREAPIVILILVAMLDVTVLSAPALIFLTVRRK
ncbi:MAG TPA: hypothetical protein VIR01_04790 [Pyrinomonadaceae bacterium]